MRTADLSNPLVDVLGLAFVTLLLVFQSRERRVRVRRLPLIPGVVLLLSALSVSRDPPTEPSGWTWLAAGLVLGLALGTSRGALTRIQHVDRAAGLLRIRSSPWGVLLWFAAFALRVVVRQLVASSAPDAATARLAAGTLLMLALGTVLANALVLYRAYRLASTAPTPPTGSSVVVSHGWRGTR